MKKLKKIILIFIILITVFSNNIVRADDSETTEEDSFSFSSIFSSASEWLSKGQEGQEDEVEVTEENDDGSITTTTKERDLTGAFDTIYSVLFGIAVCLTVIIGGILGIKFMLASAEDKAEIKNAMIPYVIGCVVVYGAFAIWKIAVNILQALI